MSQFILSFDEINLAQLRLSHARATADILSGFLQCVSPDASYPCLESPHSLHTQIVHILDELNHVDEILSNAKAQAQK